MTDVSVVHFEWDARPMFSTGTRVALEVEPGLHGRLEGQDLAAFLLTVQTAHLLDQFGTVFNLKQSKK